VWILIGAILGYVAVLIIRALTRKEEAPFALTPDDLEPVPTMQDSNDDLTTVEHWVNTTNIPVKPKRKYVKKPKKEVVVPNKKKKSLSAKK